MRKFCLLIHRWLAIPTGIFIALMCFTGALMLWKGDVAALLGCEPNDIEFFRVLTRLHRWLFIVPENPHGGMSVGRFIMGISAIACTLILLSGIVLWWPKSKKHLKSRLSVHTRMGFRRFVYDSHVSLGIYAAVFLLLMSLTGPVWSFGWYRSAALAVIGAKDSGRPGGKPSDARPDFKKEGRPQDENRPHGDRGHATDGRGHTPETARGNNPHDRNGNPQEQNSGNPHGKKGGNPAQRTFISLHMGKWGGTATKVIYCLAAIIGGFLPISGYWMWGKRKMIND